MRRRDRAYDAPVPRLPPTVVLAAAIAGLLVVAGCGDTAEKNDYVDQVNAVQDELVNQITAGPTTLGSQKAAADYAGKIAAIFNQAANDFGAIDPPADVAGLHAKLVEQMRAIATDTAKAEKTLRTGSTQEAQQALTDLQNEASSAQTEFTSVIDQINSDLRD